jgi:Uma2 family endonuclease
MIDAGVFGPDERVELIDGEVVAMAPIGDRHVESVLGFTNVFAEQSRGAAVISVQNPVELGQSSRPQPDLVLLRPPRSRYRGRLPSVDDVLLLVEVADSSLASDRGAKLGFYARAGIVEVWLANLIDDCLLVCREPSPEGYRLVRTARRGETVAPAAFPDWAIAVDEVLPAP